MVIRSYDLISMLQEMEHVFLQECEAEWCPKRRGPLFRLLKKHSTSIPGGKSRSEVLLCFDLVMRKSRAFRLLDQIQSNVSAFIADKTRVRIHFVINNLTDANGKEITNYLKNKVLVLIDYATPQSQ